MIGELFLHEYDAECLNCRVPGKCDQSDDRCGIKRGVKYGLYPKSALKSPSPAVCSVTNKDTVGFKETFSINDTTEIRRKINKMKVSGYEYTEFRF